MLHLKKIPSISPLGCVLLLIKSRTNKLHTSRSRVGHICFYAHCITIESKSNLRQSLMKSLSPVIMTTIQVIIIIIVIFKQLRKWCKIPE